MTLETKHKVTIICAVIAAIGGIISALILAAPNKPEMSLDTPNITITQRQTEERTKPADATPASIPAAKPPYPFNVDLVRFDFVNPLPNENELWESHFYIVEYWFPYRGESPVNAYRYVGYRQPNIDFSQASGSWVISNDVAATKAFNEMWRNKTTAAGNIANPIEDPDRIFG